MHEMEPQSGPTPMQVLADLPRHHARIRPNATAMIHEDRRTTYAELDLRTNQVANGLIEAGIAPQRRVAFLDKNSDRYFDLLLGTAKSNTVLVPVNWRLAPPEIAYVINDAEAEALVIGSEFLPVLAKIRDDLTTVKLITVVGAPQADHPDFDAWQARQSDSDPGLAAGAEDVVVQLYTSGTTGHPKGVELTNGNILTALAMTANGGMGKWDGDREINIVCLPVFHIGGTGWGLYGLYSGATDIIVREFDAGRILDIFATWPVTKAGFVPAVILLLLQHPDCATTDFRHLTLIGYGASPIPLDLLRQGLAAFKCGFIQLYGLTETTGAAITLQPEDHDAAGTPKMRSCGKPLPGMAVRIVGSDGADVATGEVGEILLRGPLIAKGYWNLPEATAKAIVDGWFHTGDAGYMDEDGYVYIHDRVKDMIVSGGENIYPAEVESALFGHPAIADVAVIGVPDTQWGEAVKAFVVLKPGASVAPDELIAHARQQIAGFKCPKSVDFVAVLPRNPSGKLLKRELRAPFWAGRERQVD